MTPPPTNPCTGNILAAILELPLIEPQAVKFCNSYLAPLPSMTSKRDVDQASTVTTIPAPPVETGYVISDMLARDLQKIRELEQRHMSTSSTPSPKPTLGPLPSWVAGYAASQISAACSCVESAYCSTEGNCASTEAKHKRRGYREATVAVEVQPTTIPSVESVQGGRSGGRAGRGGKARIDNVEDVQVELV